MAKVTFEIFNNGTEPLYNVDPIVEETTGNKHVYISPTLSVQRIDPGKGIRYTALITTDKWLKNGNITLKVYGTTRLTHSHCNTRSSTFLLERNKE